MQNKIDLDLIVYLLHFEFAINDGRFGFIMSLFPVVKNRLIKLLVGKEQRTKTNFGGSINFLLRNLFVFT